MSATNIGKLWKKIERTERKIENSSVEVSAPGFRQNMYGGFDREDFSVELFELYSQHISQDASDVYGKYRFAGALMRGCEFDRARSLYQEVRQEEVSALIMLAMLELKCRNQMLAEEHLAAYNRRNIEEGRPYMVRTLDHIRLPN
jgi:hypothetical protein